jgi:hypothetical protein
VTGHRADALSADKQALRAKIAGALDLLAAAAARVVEESTALCAPLELRMVSPLADGADQLTAEIALTRGWQLQAILPFGRSEYRESLESGDARATLDAQIDDAACLLELPGSLEQLVEAYVMAGRATIAHCDVLLAIWDGLPPRGRGGTGEIVQLALTKGTPVVHLPTKNERLPRLLWSAFDPNVMTIADDAPVERTLNVESVEAMLTRLLLPPPDADERKYLQAFADERLRRFRARIEYPLLLAAAGAKKFRPKSFSNRHYSAQVEHEWRTYRERCADPHNLAPPIGLLENAYSWADRLATHFAQTYRSGHIFNFVLGGLAVCLGLSAFMAPHLQFEGAALEMLITVAIIANAMIGTRNEWHRRWLDYRQLAERLRPMRSLKLLGIAAPDPPGTLTNPVPRRWIDWYAAALWRGMGCPAGRIDVARASDLARAVADHEVAPQLEYHELNASQIDQLDRRLNQVGIGLFAGTLIVSIVTLVGLATNAQWVSDYSNWFTLVQAGFPALGTAVFGIRFQADFGGDAIRSRATANALRHIDEELRKDVSLSRAADLTEQAARTMLADLDEWRLVNQQRELEMG